MILKDLLLVVPSYQIVEIVINDGRIISGQYADVKSSITSEMLECKVTSVVAYKDCLKIWS